MFEGAGNKIKVCAKILFALSVILVLILAIINIINNGFHAGMLISILGGGLIAPYIGCLLLAAFGDLVQSSSEIAQYSKETAEYLSEFHEANKNQHMPKSKSFAAPSNTDSALAAPKSTGTIGTIPKHSQTYKLLTKALQFSTDDGCRNHIMDNIDILNDEEKEMLVPIKQYLTSSSSGIRVAIEKLLKLR